MKTFNFQEQMRMSEGVSDIYDIEKILLKEFPHAVKIRKAAQAEDKDGTDYWMTLPYGHEQSIDVKVRDEDFQRQGKDDLALETWSVIKGQDHQKVGWTRDTMKRTDYIFWIWKDTGRWMLVPFPLLCSVFCEHWKQWSKQYQNATQRTLDGWHSKCVFVPRQIVWDAIYTSFGGLSYTSKEDEWPSDF